jgi:hypothetical protein
MKNRIQKISTFLNEKIISLCNSKEFEKYRSFYGECFALSSLVKSNKLNEDTKSYLISEYRKKDKSDSEFHHEFNNYAILTDEALSSEFKEDFYPIVFKNTPCTNWTLLRERVKLQLDSNYELAEAKEKIYLYQLESGLILDDPGVKSFQYHCFSMVMIGEMYLITRDEELKSSFIKGIQFIVPFISPTGETLFVGRGQNQSFGYSALLYLLVLAQNILDSSFQDEIELILVLLEEQVDKFNDLPLMLNQPLENPYLVDMEDSKFYGWYPYNNYADYFCFSSYFITKAFNDYKDYKDRYEYKESLNLSEFIIKNNEYFSVVSNTGGYWSNDLPIPFIQYNKENILPMYGGEQFQKSLYCVEDIPLPINKLLGKSIRIKSRSKIVDDSLIVKSFLGNLKRHFEFKKSSIVITNEMLLPFLFESPYFFFKGTKEIDEKTLVYKNVEFHFSRPFKKGRPGFSSSGELLRYTVEGEHQLEIVFL